MLVISRVLGDGFCIGDDLAIQVLRIEEDKVQFGIADPKEEMPWPASEAVMKTAFELKRDEKTKFEPQSLLLVVLDIRTPSDPQMSDKVRIGIECPANIPVHRKEVYDAIKRHESRDAK